MITREALRTLAEAGLTGEPYPVFPGVVLGVDDGSARTTVAAGDAVRYGPDGLLPAAARPPVTAETVFDLASLTKLVTTLVALSVLDDLDAPLARTLSAYDRPATRAITARHLLTHTAGLPAVLRLWETEPDPARRPDAVLAADPVAPVAAAVTYSCTGFLVLQQLLERTTGQGLDALVAARVAEPLGLSLGYRPRRAGLPADRIAATELRDAAYLRLLGPELATMTPDPTDLRGLVHDENAASLGGVAGNAGLFGTAADLLSLGRAVLDGLTGRNDPWGLDQARLRDAVAPQLGPEINQPAYASGLGFRIDDPGFMAGLAGTGEAYGHTGFTGTSLVLDARRDLVVVILSNGVHPQRGRSDLQAFRRTVHDAVAGG